MISQMSNEQLCIAALDGDTEARNALVENNLRFIKRTAYEMWSAQQELNAALGLEINDLVQEGALGLLDCIAGYRPDTGNKFLTYAAPAIRNAMVDYIRRWNPTFEAKNPEQIYIAKETHEEIHTALQRIDRRERTYLWYRFGFEDDMEHPLNETAKHFYLSESRARSTEALALDNVWLELPWWF